VERRRHRRFKVDGRAIAYYRTNSPKVAEIIDISPGGVALSHVGGAEAPDSRFELEIVFPDRTDYVDRIPCVAVSDCRIDSESRTRRCGASFGKLTGQQQAKIQTFIDTFCWRADC